ncbi:MAG TPA: hypothetical protein VGL56_17115 [Fimbriimonadaceae bacterium]|jgi:hypothetical protein
MKRLPSFVLIPLAMAIAGCGGGGGGTSGTALASPVVPIFWAQRTRSTIQGPTSALSAAITFKGVGTNGGDISFEVDRNSSPASYTASYPSPIGAVENSPCTMVVSFHAAAGGTGPVTGIATASVEVGPNGVLTYANGSKLGTVGSSSQLSNIAVVPNQQVKVGQTLTVAVQATDAQGDVFVITPGSVSLALGQGSQNVTMRPNGDLVGESAGTIMVTPTVDGLTGLAGKITVLAISLTPRNLVQATSAMVQNPVTGTLWASVPNTAPTFANNVIEVDPTSGSILHHIFVGNNPGPLDVSSDGTMLYVALNQPGAICPVNLTTFTAGNPFPLSTAANPPNFAFDLKVDPGNPNIVAASTSVSGNIGNTGPTIYSSGVALPNKLGESMGTVLAWGNATTLYAFVGDDTSAILNQCVVNASGATLEHSLSNTFLDGTQTLHTFGSRIYGPDGTVVNASTGAVVGRVNSNAYPQLGDIVVNPIDNIAAISQQPNDNGTESFAMFNTATFLQTGTVTLTGLDTEDVNHGIAIYGGTGLAFRTNDHIYFMDQMPGL